MRLVLIIILGFIALSIITAIVGPLIVLGIGAMLAYYAYKNLVRSNNSALSILWWIIVGATGISLFIGALPGFIFMVAIAALAYFAFRKSSPKAQPNVSTSSSESSLFGEYESFEAEWREITKG